MMTATSANSIEQVAAHSGNRVPQQGAGKSEAAVHPPQIQNILVAVDFSEYSRAALNYASFLAERFGATLTLVHAVEPYVYPEDLSAGFTLEEIDARWMQKQKDKLETLQHTIQEGISTQVVVTMGCAWNRIIGTAKSGKADLIVVGTHGRTGLKHALMGSTAERIVRHASCPVIVVHMPRK
jgi:universal stress protein A